MKNLLLLNLIFLSINLFSQNGKIIADVQFAEHGSDRCNLHVEFVNETEEVFVEVYLYAKALVFDKDGIVVMHGGMFDKNNELYFRLTERVFRPGAVSVGESDIEASWDNAQAQCSRISDIEFNLFRGSAKTARGEDISLNDFIDTDIKKYSMKKLQELRW